MPPIQQQQTSRGGLIAALVVSIVFAVGFLIWAFMSNAELNKAQTQLASQQAKYGKVIADSAVGDLSTLQGQFSADPEKPRTGTLVDVAADQRRTLVKLISGRADGSEKDATSDANLVLTALKSSPALKDTPVPDGASLTQVIALLTTKAQSDFDALTKARADLASANQQLQSSIETQKAEIAKRDQAVADAQAASAKAQADAKAAIDEKQKQVDDFAAKVAMAEKTVNDLQAQGQVEVQTIRRELEKAKKDFDTQNGRLAQYRPNVKESVIRNVDATITQVAADSVCYVNLGYGDHISPGLTFEVYDKFEGIPKLNDGTSALDMPKGKASIEVINVGQNSSQCRVTRTSPGMTVSQGDLCANLVYDRNIKPLFYVYGKFDMDQNGVATEQEAEVVKNLITRWGGRIADRVSMDVDFVIMGKEPSVPLYSPEELQNPLNKAKQDEAKAQLAAYNAVRDDAVGLHIPLMNQNRFLYYTGYFEASKK
jgi:hypothetical protein